MAARSHPGADTSEAAGSPAGAARPAEGPETAPRAAPAALPSPAPAAAAGPCSEELVLTCTFEACDPEQTGKVPVSRIMEYLQAVTGRGGEEGRLRALRGMLDPGGTGAALDLATFHAVMTAWIADCRRERGAERAAERDGSADDTGVPPPEQGGGPAPPAAQLEGYGGDAERPGAEEAAALAGLVEDLDCSNRRLATENAALRSAAESAEELNARLAEEVAGLRGRLRGARQALGQAEAAARELDDLKAVAERLEEANAELRAQLRQLERERQGLLARAGGLREENEKLQAEGEWARQRIRALAAEKADLEARLRQREELLSRGEAALAERTRQAEELRASLEQHRHAVQELRREAAGLREQLGRTRDASAAPPWGPRGDADADTDAGGPAQPLCAEIEATRQGAAADAGLPSPLCGRTPEPCRAAQGADGDGSAEPSGAPAGTQPRQRRSPESGETADRSWPERDGRPEHQRSRARPPTAPSRPGQSRFLAARGWRSLMLTETTAKRLDSGPGRKPRARPVRGSPAWHLCAERPSRSSGSPTERAGTLLALRDARNRPRSGPIRQRSPRPTPPTGPPDARPGGQDRHGQAPHGAAGPDRPPAPSASWPPSAAGAAGAAAPGAALPAAPRAAPWLGPGPGGRRPPAPPAPPPPPAPINASATAAPARPQAASPAGRSAGMRHRRGGLGMTKPPPGPGAAKPPAGIRGPGGSGRHGAHSRRRRSVPRVYSGPPPGRGGGARRCPRSKRNERAAAAPPRPLWSSGGSDSPRRRLPPGLWAPGTGPSASDPVGWAAARLPAPVRAATAASPSPGPAAARRQGAGSARRRGRVRPGDPAEAPPRAAGSPVRGGGRGRCRWGARGPQRIAHFRRELFFLRPLLIFSLCFRISRTSV